MTLGQVLSSECKVWLNDGDDDDDDDDVVIHSTLRYTRRHLRISS